MENPDGYAGQLITSAEQLHPPEPGRAVANDIYNQLLISSEWLREPLSVDDVYRISGYVSEYFSGWTWSQVSERAGAARGGVYKASERHIKEMGRFFKPHEWTAFDAWHELSDDKKEEIMSGIVGRLEELEAQARVYAARMGSSAMGDQKVEDFMRTYMREHVGDVSPGWEEGALCAQSDPEAFFPENSKKVPRIVKRICNACPVRDECSPAGQDWKGIWAADDYRTRHKRQDEAS